MLTATPRIELLTDLTAIEEADWDRILADSTTRTVFQTMSWQRAWWATFGRGQLLPIAVFDGAHLVAVAPLFADHGMIFFVGSGGSDYLDFIGAAHRPNILHEILEFARETTPEFVGFRFYHVPDVSPTGRSLVATAPKLHLSCFDEGALHAPALRFADWPAAKRAPAEKKSLLRHERAMRKRGRLEVDHFTEHAQVAGLLPLFFEQHVARWAGTSFPSLFLDDQQREFYHRLSEYVAARGWLRFSRVSWNDEPVAFHFGFHFEDEFLWYKPSFDIRRAEQSPGEVLLRSLLLEAQDEQATIFDFGLGDEPFKQRFTTHVRRVRTWGLYPASDDCKTPKSGAIG